MFKTLFLSAAIALTAAAPVHSAALNRAVLPDLSSAAAPVENIAFNKNRKSRTGAEKLKRLFKPHFVRTVITRDIRAATGDPNIVVFDHRAGSSSVYRCSYINYRGKRALQCD